MSRTVTNLVSASKIFDLRRLLSNHAVLWAGADTVAQNARHIGEIRSLFHSGVSVHTQIRYHSKEAVKK